MSETGAAGFRVLQEEDDVDSGAVVRIASTSILIGGLGVAFAAWLLFEVAGTLRPNLAGARGPRLAPSQISRVEQTPIRTSRRGIDLRDAQRRELAIFAPSSSIPISRRRTTIWAECFVKMAISLARYGTANGR